MLQPQQREYRIGLICAVLAHCLWGFFPLYWNLLGQFPSLALACHRVLWACAWLTLLVPILIATGRDVSLRELRHQLSQPRIWALYTFAAVMLAINWLAFIWAVNNGAVLQASLGYYINPLLSILLGVFVLGERLESTQWLAVLVAAIGVTIMTIVGGGLPWASIAMASAFAMYGLAKKKTPLPSLSGLWVEVLILFLPALMGVWWISGTPAHRELEFTTSVWLLLVGGGAVTVLPLALFSASARRLPLSMVGMLQYVGPTLQFLVGTLVNGEAFGWGKAIGFACVWCGSLLYLFNTRRRMLKASAAHASPTEHSSSTDALPDVSSDPAAVPAPANR